MRKLATAAAVSLALASGGAFGLGLGDIEMRSALNQPMNAEIPLTSVQSGELDGMIVKLADEAAFARAGIDRSAALTDLTFSVDSSGGRPVIRIASNRPVVEPFLNFLLEVDWPQGRMVREYTVLLDPPVFMTEGPAARDEGSENRAVIERQAAAVAPAPINRTADADAAPTVEGFEVELLGADDVETVNSASSGDVVSLDELDADTAALSSAESDLLPLSDAEAPNANAQVAQAGSTGSVSDLQLSDDLFEVEIVGEEVEVGDDVGAAVAAGDESLEIVDVAEADEATRPDAVTVVRGDTLFEIATDTAGGGVSTQQMMLALLEANRSAFIDDNINLVKAGATLRIPGAAEAQALTQAQALAEIGRQNELWQQYRDNLRRTTADTQVAATEPEEEALVESETGADGASVDSATDTADAASDTTDESTAAVDTTDGLTAEARAILERARAEVLQRDELSIVTDSGNTSTGASATAAESEGDDSAQLATINRELQLAREELAASGVEGEDLDEQVAELTSTGENLDALINLRQDQVARLEEQLAQARSDAALEAAEEAAAEAEAATAAELAALDSDADGALGTDTPETNAEEAGATGLGDSVEETVGGVVDGAVGEVADASDAATNALGDAVGSGAEAVDQVAADAAEEAARLADGATGAVDGAVDEVAAGTEAGVEGVEAVTVADPAADPAGNESWFQSLMSDPTRMMIAAAGGIGLLGVLGLLLFRSRRDDEDEEMAVEFGEGSIDDPNVADSLADDAGEFDKKTGMAAAAATATAGAAAVGLADGGRDDPADLDVEMQSDFDAALQEEDDKDDTISEVDVYLAYGLHGQAEELLTKAIERKPDNGEYSQKLLETYHAQGNGEGFQRVAADFHSRFGGESNPGWARIAEMGRDLRPGEPLFGAGAATVAAMGTGQLDGPAMGDDDFADAGDVSQSSSSVSRDFTSADETIDEEALLDQSIDPAFAFDENDLEATGDFSQIADELAAERNESIDFSGFEEDANKPADQGPRGEMPLREMPSEANALEEALTLDELDMNASSAAANDAAKDRAVEAADDLVLDFDELDGTDLDATSLDEAALMDAMPNSDLSLDDQSADEMDTMMDLAKAYLDMGDKDSASNALDEVVKGGSPAQVSEAETLLRKIS